MAAQVVLVPGFMQRGAAWAPVTRALGERYPTVAVDRAGAGIEAPPGAVLCGYSLGGRLALSAALREPGRYGGLVLVGASAGIEEPVERQQRREEDERLARWIESHPIGEVVRRWESLPVFATQPPDLVDAQRPGRLSFSPAELAATLRAHGQGAFEPVWHRLPSLDVPVLAVAGDLDLRYAAAAERIASLCPNAEWEVIPRAGHACHLERPDTFAEVVIPFLDRCGLH